MAYQNYVLICGGTACCSGGADRLVEEFAANLESAGIKDTVQVVKTGCMGLCHSKPTVEVVVPGMPTVIYGHVDAATAKAIVEKHIIGKELISDKILDKPSIDIVKNA